MSARTPKAVREYLSRPPEAVREYFAKFGKQGGKKRAANMTAEQRSDVARRASQARWARKRAAA
ncbi:MAG: hypothetical protein ABSG13_02890 [Bryobacteraceae bacterium]